MPTNAYWDEPRPQLVRFATLAEARAAREDAERTLGAPLPKTKEELRLEADAAERAKR